MEFTILGSGGNTPTPLPTCECTICEEAREKGTPYAHRGNAIFLHDENILIDTPELVWGSLNRQGIMDIDYVFLSHFHADHTLGLRTLQAIGLEEPPVTDFIGDTPTLVMSEETYERTIEATEFFGLLTDQWADIELMGPNESRTVGDLDLTHLVAPIEPEGPNAVSGFLFESNESTAFVSPDENRHFDLQALPALDLWIKETGYFPEDPEGTPLVTDTAERNAIEHELSFQESMEQVRTVAPDRTVLTEIEELFRRSYDDYLALEDQYEELNIAFAYDGMEIEV